MIDWDEFQQVERWKVLKVELQCSFITFQYFNANLQIYREIDKVTLLGINNSGSGAVEEDI